MRHNNNKTKNSLLCQVSGCVLFSSWFHISKDKKWILHFYCDGHFTNFAKPNGIGKHGNWEHYYGEFDEFIIHNEKVKKK